MEARLLDGVTVHERCLRPATRIAWLLSYDEEDDRPVQ